MFISQYNLRPCGKLLCLRSLQTNTLWTGFKKYASGDKHLIKNFLFAIFHCWDAPWSNRPQQESRMKFTHIYFRSLWRRKKSPSLPPGKPNLTDPRQLQERRRVQIKPKQGPARRQGTRLRLRVAVLRPGVVDFAPSREDVTPVMKNKHGKGVSGSTALCGSIKGHGGKERLWISLSCLLDLNTQLKINAGRSAGGGGL